MVAQQCLALSRRRGPQTCWRLSLWLVLGILALALGFQGPFPAFLHPRKTSTNPRPFPGVDRAVFFRLSSIRVRGNANLDYYAILGVPRDADDATIKQAFRMRAKETHPDVSASENSTVEYMLVKEAYDVLYDQERRSAFDRKMRAKDMAGLAVGMTEILATDVAIPLARDVAMPILNFTLYSISNEGNKVWKQAMPFFNKAITSIKQSTANTPLGQAAQEAAEKTRRQQLAQRLKEVSKMAEESRAAAVVAAQQLDQQLVFEVELKSKLEQEMAMSESVSQRLVVMEEERVRVAKAFDEAVSNESNFRRTVEHLTNEDERLATFVDSTEMLFNSAKSELDEAEEAFLKAKQRLEQAQLGKSRALEQLEDAKVSKQAMQTRLSEAKDHLVKIGQTLSRETGVMDDILRQESELETVARKHLSKLELLKEGLSEAVQRREAAQKQLARHEENAKKRSEEALKLAAKVKESFRGADELPNPKKSSTNSMPSTPSSKPKGMGNQKGGDLGYSFQLDN